MVAKDRWIVVNVEDMIVDAVSACQRAMTTVQRTESHAGSQGYLTQACILFACLHHTGSVV